MSYNVQDESKKLALSAYNTTLDGIQMAFALIVALAWYKLVSTIVKRYSPSEDKGIKLLLLFAVAMTVIFVVLMAIIKKFPWKAPSGLSVTYAIVA